jgi:hypothetical protein
MLYNKVFSSTVIQHVHVSLEMVEEFYRLFSMCTRKCNSEPPDCEPSANHSSTVTLVARHIC